MLVELQALGESVAFQLHQDQVFAATEQDGSFIWRPISSIKQKYKN